MASTGSDLPLDPDLLHKIQSAVLKDEGCFITSRMLCRRYSALFKVHHVVQAMQAMVLPPDDERHIGVFKFINERTKVANNVSVSDERACVVAANSSWLT